VWTRATVRVWSEDGPLPVVRAGDHGLGHWCGRLVPLGQMVRWVVQQSFPVLPKVAIGWVVSA
jgi:hypothetical protein